MRRVHFPRYGDWRHGRPFGWSDAVESSYVAQADVEPAAEGVCRALLPPPSLCLLVKKLYGTGSGGDGSEYMSELPWMHAPARAGLVRRPGGVGCRTPPRRLRIASRVGMRVGTD